VVLVLPLILKVWPFGSKVHFLFFSLLIAGCHASSLVLRSEVAILVFFNILNDHIYDTIT
jgi:hypothetical protein